MKDAREIWAMQAVLSSLPQEQIGRIEHLLLNPNSGREVIGKTSSGKEIKSNCWGTALYVLGMVPQKIEEPHALNFPQSFPAEGRPGYVEWNILQGIVEVAFRKNISPLPGSLAFFERHPSYPIEFLNQPGRRTVHAGVFVEDNTIFEQRQLGEEFRLRTLGAIEREFYIITSYSPIE